MDLTTLPKTELHMHLDGSIPMELTWQLMTEYRLNPRPTLEETERLLTMQPEDETSLLAYLDKFSYPLWITQFYENIQGATIAILDRLAALNVTLAELRYSPIVHTYAGLTVRQAIRAVLSGMNHARKAHGMRVGLIVIAMRQHGPHIAKILARQAIAEGQRFHRRSGVVGFDIAGAERGNPPGLFREAFLLARHGGLGLTVHAGEDEGPRSVWEAVDELGARRIGHGCSALQDMTLVQRLARDRILVECCVTSNYQTGAVPRGARHPIFTFLEHGVPVAICVDNATVSRTDSVRESALVADEVGLDEVIRIHRQAREFSFIAADAPSGSGNPDGEAREP
ncbi:MAG: adenosine deaminase [Candidatus Eisenbacteria bacterium]|jgi:adenosine deaminase|nr:adenosine deaminase [Candidatus Eisenbacteria bacterium]